MNSIVSIVFYSILSQCIIYLPIVFILFIAIFGVSYYYLNSCLSGTETKNVLNYIRINGYYHSSCIDESKIVPHNTFFICFKPFVFGYINTEYKERDTNNVIYLVLRKKNLHKLTENNNKVKIVKKKNINVYGICGRASWNVKIEKIRKYNEPKFIPHMNIIKNVIDEYKYIVENDLLGNGYLGCLFYGQPGTGKSSIGYNIALKLDSNIVMNFDPTTLGLRLNDFLKSHEHSIEKPIVIVINEFDKIVKNCFEEKLENKTEYFRMAHSKPTLNNFLDDLRMEKGVILICSSNETIEWFNYNNFDSVIRDGRINIRQEIGKLSNNDIRILNRLGYKCDESKLLCSVKKK